MKSPETQAVIQMPTAQQMGVNPALTTFGYSVGIGMAVVLTAFGLYSRFFKAKGEASDVQGRGSLLAYYQRTIESLTAQRDAAQTINQNNAQLLGELTAKVAYQAQQIETQTTQIAVQTRELQGLREEIRDLLGDMNELRIELAHYQERKDD
jgi:uncharacterized coiled-coil protein SlyX